MLIVGPFDRGPTKPYGSKEIKGYPFQAARCRPTCSERKYSTNAPRPKADHVRTLIISVDRLHHHIRICPLSGYGPPKRALPGGRQAAGPQGFRSARAPTAPWRRDLPRPRNHPQFSAGISHNRIVLRRGVSVLWEVGVAASQPPLLDRLRAVVRRNHYSRRTTISPLRIVPSVTSQPGFSIDPYPPNIPTTRY